MRRVKVWRAVGGLTCALALVATAACSSGNPNATFSPPSGTNGSSPTSPPVVSSMDVVPANKAKNVSPADAVSASVVNGTLTEVTLKSSGGQTIKGAFDGSHAAWHNTQQLAYNASYSLTVTGSGQDGKQFSDTRTFSTVHPGNLTLPYLRANGGMLLDKGTFGIGQPIVVWFDEEIKDRAAAEKSLVVQTDPPGIVGGWYWINNHEVHWRPMVYWPSGTKVTISANVYGRNLGGGLYGQENVSASFTIGQAHVAVADAKTHMMKVFIDGKLVTKINGFDVTKGIPVSMGKGGTETTPAGVTIDFNTNSGPHVIMQKFEHIIMRSDSFGITDPKDPNYYIANIAKALQISGDGEFVHLADWNIPQQGHVNTSHGCINVGPNYIYWFYNTFQSGDIVDVTGTPRHLALTNGLGDWTLTWAQWQKGSALSS
jgi:lipoprotein-anchoring transpeptidase ErfK/SrfK